MVLPVCGRRYGLVIKSAVNLMHEVIDARDGYRAGSMQVRILSRMTCLQADGYLRAILTAVAIIAGLTAFYVFTH